jgi:hypothetical protein
VDRLTDHLNYPIDGFRRCQLCGHEAKDATEFRMWYECDEQDKAETDKVVVLCRQDACNKVMQDHPRLYRPVPWGAGAPGHLFFLCGACKHRKGTTCSHPGLKANGGEGLLITISGLFAGSMHVCGYDDETEEVTNMTHAMPRPATECAGKEDL